MISNSSNEKLAEECVQTLKDSADYTSLYSEIQRLVCTSSVKRTDFKNTLSSAVKSCGLENEMKNLVYHWMRNRSVDDNGQIGAGDGKCDWKTHLEKIQAHWEKRVHKSIKSMCSCEGNEPLAKMRVKEEQDQLVEKWTELSTLDLDLSQIKPVYAPKDFLEVLLSIYSPKEKESCTYSLPWQFTHIPLQVKNLSDLRSFYAEFTRGEPLLGVNPYMSVENYPTLEAERTINGQKVIDENNAPTSKEFLKRGSPRELRNKLWMQVLGSGVKKHHYAYFESLKKQVLQYDLMVDKIVFRDIQLTACNDDQYFVFQDVLYQVLLCFSHDTEVLSALGNKFGPPLQVQVKKNPLAPPTTMLFSPSGVIPFHGFSMYATPFCYLNDDPVALYFTFRKFYLRYFHRLHTLSLDHQGILSLCLLFERLLQTHDAQLWVHIKNCGIQPVRLVFKWLMRAFSGHLPPEQLLYLWDVILAYDSLEIVALLAVCIVIFRKETLTQVDSLTQMESILSDLSTISVMALIQMALLSY